MVSQCFWKRRRAKHEFKNRSIIFSLKKQASKFMPKQTKGSRSWTITRKAGEQGSLLCEFRWGLLCSTSWKWYNTALLDGCYPERENQKHSVTGMKFVCYTSRKLRVSLVESGHGWEASVLTTFFIFLFVPGLTAFFGWLLVWLDQLKGLAESIFLFSWFVARLLIDAGTLCASLREELGVGAGGAAQPAQVWSWVEMQAAWQSS